MIRKVMFKLGKVLYSKFNFPFYKEIGKSAFVYKPMLVEGKKYIQLGRNVFFRNGARIECIDRWLDNKYSPKLIIGENTSFEQDAHITTAGELKIGKNCTFSARTMITTINHEFDDLGNDILNQGIVIKNVCIGENCFIGMDVKIFPGVTIGDNVIIGANSIVMSDVPSNSIAVGTPAKVIKKYDFELKKWIRI